MQIATLVQMLDQPHVAATHFEEWGLRDPDRGHAALVRLAESGLTLDLLAVLCTQLGKHLPSLANADAVLAALERYLAASRSPLAVAALFERDPAALPLLLKALSLGPAWEVLLTQDTEAFDLLRQAEGVPAERDELVRGVTSELAALDDDPSIAAALARFYGRQMLRIACGELVGQQRFELVASQLTALAEAQLEAALRTAERKATGARSVPLRFCILGLGRLGGAELDYGRRHKLLFIYEAAPCDAAEWKAAGEQAERVARLFARLLTERSDADSAVEFVSLPDGSQTSSAHSVEDAVYGFDAYGRTWHRDQMLKVRPVAGDLALGAALVARLQSWLFRRYLNPADEAGILALKRRILQDAAQNQDERRDLANARGGLANLEATVRLLQLLFGGDHPEIRTGNTLSAIASLEQAGILAVEERAVLEENYIYFRRAEHRQQIRGFATADAEASELADRLDRTWQTLQKILASAFAEEPAVSREVELLLDPAPADEEVRAALAPFGFQNSAAALQSLRDLAQEHIPFLSTRHCRHALAQVLPQLLCAAAATPNPDFTLDNLARIAGSLGGKGVLWELFRTYPPALELFVKLCAASPYLSGILTTRPGMIDALVDSLQLQRLPTLVQQQSAFEELSRGAQGNVPFLHDFKTAQHLRIGVRDILGKEPIEETHAALADVAEICLSHIAERESSRLAEKFGPPTLGPGPRAGEPCRLVVLGLGKLGGREPNYHSELSVVFLYEGEGTTEPAARSRRDQRTTNNHFFTQLAQGILKATAELTPQGRLYAIDTVLRPIGVGGALAMSLADFAQHFSSGAAPLWQWLELCQARAVVGEESLRAAADEMLRQLLIERQPACVDRGELWQARQALERGAAPLNLKRAAGGTLDIEFLVHLLQLELAAANPAVLVPSTQQALDRLADAGALSAADAERLGDAYRFLRRVESGLRLLDTAARHDLPEGGEDLSRVALLIGHSNPDKLRAQCEEWMRETRSILARHVPPADSTGA
jgi:glutamate-ammonia-ligase adenylyltransferase